VRSLKDMKDVFLRAMWVLRELEDSDNEGRDNTDSIPNMLRVNHSERGRQRAQG
jgi:hypothetical protein